MWVHKKGIEGAQRRKKLLGRPSGPSQETLEKYQYALHLYNNKHIAIDKAANKLRLVKPLTELIKTTNELLYGRRIQ